MSAILIGARRLSIVTRYAACASPHHSVLTPPQPQFQHVPHQRNIHLVPDIVRNYYLTPDFPPIGGIINLLTSVHDMTGLPWWASIAITTIGLRTVWTLPLSIYGRQLQNRRQLLKPELEQIKRQTVGDVQHIMKYHKWNERLGGQALSAQVKAATAELYKRDNCHPGKLLMIPFMQIPLWLSFSFALRNMAGFLPLRGQDLPVLCPDMALEGTLWFSNFLLPDTYMILAVSTMLMNLINLEISVLSMDDSSRLIRFGNMFARFFSLWLVPISAYIPSVIVWYWFLSASTALTQNIVLRLPSVKTRLGIKPVPGDTDTPFRDILKTAHKRYWLREPRGPKPDTTKSSSTNFSTTDFSTTKLDRVKAKDSIAEPAKPKAKDSIAEPAKPKPKKLKIRDEEAKQLERELWTKIKTKYLWGGRKGGEDGKTNN